MFPDLQDDLVARLPWKQMDTAPRDGTVFAVKFHAWNVSSNPAQIQLAQWINLYGAGSFCQPYQIDSKVYADGWLTLDELQNATEALLPADVPERD